MTDRLERLIARLNVGHELAPYEGIGTNRQLEQLEYAAMGAGLRGMDDHWLWWMIYEDSDAKTALVAFLAHIIKGALPYAKTPQVLAEGLLLDYSAPDNCSTCSGTGVQKKNLYKSCLTCGGTGRRRISTRSIGRALGISSGYAQEKKHDIRAVVNRCEKWMNDRNTAVERKVRKNQ